MRGKNVFWGIFFIVMAVIVIASKIGILPDVGIFTILASAVLIWAVVDGIRRRNLYETIFAAAFLLIIYEKSAAHRRADAVDDIGCCAAFQHWFFDSVWHP